MREIEIQGQGRRKFEIQGQDELEPPGRRDFEIQGRREFEIEGTHVLSYRHGGKQCRPLRTVFRQMRRRPTHRTILVVTLRRYVVVQADARKQTGASRVQHQGYWHRRATGEIIPRRASRPRA